MSQNFLIERLVLYYAGRVALYSWPGLKLNSTFPSIQFLKMVFLFLKDLTKIVKAVASYCMWGKNDCFTTEEIFFIFYFYIFYSLILHFCLQTWQLKMLLWKMLGPFQPTEIRGRNTRKLGYLHLRFKNSPYIQKTKKTTQKLFV